MTKQATSHERQARGVSVRDTAWRRVAATMCSTALILSMLAFVPSIVMFTGAASVCFVTMVVALACVRATPRLAVATLYWSVGSLLASPMIVDLHPWAIGGLAIVGLVLLVGLSIHYDEA